MNKTTTQTPAELRETNPAFPQWMRDACEDAELVRVTRKHTPFGTFVVAVEPVR